MPRSTPAAIWGCTLALAAGSTPPVATAQAVSEPPYRFVTRFTRLSPASHLLIVVRPGQSAPQEDQLVATPKQCLLTPPAPDFFLFGPKGAAPKRAELDTILDSRIDSAARELSLTDSQRAKLRLAGRRDIQLLLDRIETIRDEFRRIEYPSIFIVDVDRKYLADVFRPIRTASAEGPFGDGSLFDKVRRTIARREQAAAREAR
jgi:hypothetical protein